MIEAQKEEVNIKVSVCVVTYNQKNYIRQCLDSLISQKTNFRYEIIVGDDASTDGTSEIVEEYGARYPDLVVPVLHKRNIGPVANMVALYRMARGEYIAHIDGDDLALPGKLQRQADMLDDNSGCAICTHDVVVIDRKSKLLNGSFRRHREGVCTLADLYKKLPFFAHSSKMFRNNRGFPLWDRLSPDTIDIEIHVEQARNGGIYHIDDRLGAYRYSVGMSSAGQAVNPKVVEATTRVYTAALRDGCDGLTRQEIKRYYARAILNYSYQSALFGRAKCCKEYAIRSISICFFSPLQIALLFAAILPGGIGVAQIRRRLRGWGRAAA